MLARAHGWHVQHLKHAGIWTAYMQVRTGISEPSRSLLMLPTLRVAPQNSCRSAHAELHGGPLQNY